jgi:hypothetical protein
MSATWCGLVKTSSPRWAACERSLFPQDGDGAESMDLLGNKMVDGIEIEGEVDVGLTQKSLRETLHEAAANRARLIKENGRK